METKHCTFHEEHPMVILCAVVVGVVWLAVLLFPKSEWDTQYPMKCRHDYDGGETRIWTGADDVVHATTAPMTEFVNCEGGVHFEVKP